MKKNNLLLVILMSTISLSYGQTSFSIAEAIEYSVNNNANIKNALLGMEIANQKVKETTAIGLPQVTATGQFQNFLDIPITVAPAIAFNPNANPGDLVELQFGTEYNATGALSVNQLLFSGSYIVGLQTSKTYKAVSEYQKDKSIIDTKEMVMKAYYGVLVAGKTVKSLQEISATSERIYKETQAFYKEGLIEEDNVTQLSLNVLNSKNTLKNAERQLEYAKSVLKLQMGYDMNQDITLTSEFESVVSSLKPEVSAIESDVNQNIDFMLLNKQLELSKLNVKYEQSQYLPTLTAFFNHQQQALRNDFNLLDGSQPWYPTTIWGLNLSVPIFTGGSNRAQVAQAQISVMQNENSIAQFNDGITLQTQSVKFNYDNAYDNYLTSKESVAISKKIYSNYQIKFKEGLISSLDLSQIQTQYLSAETQYIQAMYGLINAKIELDKITNKL